MKILIFSDSHGNCIEMFMAVKRHEPDLLLHLGDCVKDAYAISVEFPELPVRYIKGNNDFNTNAPEFDEFVVEGVRFFMTHGHKYYVKSTTANAINAAISRNANVLLYGHTHSPVCVEYEGLHIINPGSVGFGKKTYAELVVENGAVKCEIFICIK